MKTKFNIAWVDDNYSDEQMQSSAERLSRKVHRKNSFTLVFDDVFARAKDGKIDEILADLANTIDSSNSIDLAVIDYDLSNIVDKDGNTLTGEAIAKKFRDTLPTIDIVFYSGKQNVQNLRKILAEENVDCVNCIGRDVLVDASYQIIENVINRSCKISTLRGLVLNSVCDIDNMIVEILSKYSVKGVTEENEVKNIAINQIAKHVPSSVKARMRTRSVEVLLQDKAMMSGKLFTVLYQIKNKMSLSSAQLLLLDKYRSDILELRTSAAHAKEGVCSTTNQSMLENKNDGSLYKKSDIDQICHTIVEHENNIRSILSGMS